RGSVRPDLHFLDVRTPRSRRRHRPRFPYRAREPGARPPKGPPSSRRVLPLASASQRHLASDRYLEHNSNHTFQPGQHSAVRASSFHPFETGPAPEPSPHRPPGGRGGVFRIALHKETLMIRSSRIHLLSSLAVAVLLPVAAYAATETAAKSSAASATKVPTAQAATTTHAQHPAHLAAKTKRAPATDINSASKEDLMKLNGITDELAEKIIAGRPYKMKSELTKKQILTKAEYAKVRSHIIAKQEKTASMQEGSKKEEAGETKAQEQQENKTPPPATGK